MLDFEPRMDGVTLAGASTGHTGALGWAWLAPLITGVIEGQNKNGAEASDAFSHQQAVIAGQRASAQAQATAATYGVIAGTVLFLGLGGWAVYRLTK